MSERASFEELLEFANKVREAGGGNPLDALMPAVPQDSSKCLIAKNLNFNCQVSPGDVHDAEWVMFLGPDEETRDKIADKLGLQPLQAGNPDDGIEYGVILPPEIGAVANDFDQAWEDAQEIDRGRSQFWIGDRLDRARDLLREMGPYIDASIRETLDQGILNEKGELIL